MSPVTAIRSNRSLSWSVDCFPHSVFTLVDMSFYTSLSHSSRISCIHSRTITSLPILICPHIPHHSHLRYIELCFDWWCSNEWFARQLDDNQHICCVCVQSYMSVCLLLSPHLPIVWLYICTSSTNALHSPSSHHVPDIFFNATLLIYYVLSSPLPSYTHTIISHLI